MTTAKGTGLLSRISVLALLLPFLQVSMDVAAIPVYTYQAGSQIVVPSRVDGSCPVINMTAENHKLFYEFCYNVDSSRNETRDTAYLPGGYQSAADDFSAFENSLRNEEKVPMSDYCLQHLRPFVCFYYFPFPWPPVTEETCKTTNVTYAKPCRDFCEKTFKACETELEKMIASNTANPTDLEHLQCHNFEQENSICIRPPPIEEANTSCSTKNASSESCSQPSATEDSESTDAPTSSSSSCNCANVRDSVTQRTFTAYTFSMAAHVLVLSFREEGDHVVYMVVIIKEYQISCKLLLVAEDNITTVHTQQPLECRGDSAETTDCVYMEVGKEYMIVGHYGTRGEWLLKDLKGTGGTVVSPWIEKYEKKMDTWVKKVRPNAETC